jgi:MOSC domain-containing protein YiiM
MKLISVQVGMPREVEWQGKLVSTGIFKSAIKGPVMARKLGLEGDGQADLTVHGGERKAVYAYGLDAYDWWKNRLPNENLPPGSFGENLSFSQLLESSICIGDSYHLGEAELQVTEPRFPCFKLGIKFQDMGILKTFIESGRSGVYFAVTKEGKISSGNQLELIARPKATVSIQEFYSAFNEKCHDPDLLGRILKVESLTPKWRSRFEALLAK